ncbi:MAG: PDZ domain-containing protein [Phycisphaeraceae bacterium]|nr:PDZ domain-containing protein [Phycisphaeraceae bacterium]
MVPTLGRTATAAGLVLALSTLAGCVVVVGNTTRSYRDADGNSVMVIEDGKPLIGVNTERVSPALASQLGVNADRSTLVAYVFEGWPAARAGVKQYDVIVKVDGDDYVPPDAIRKAIRAKKPGDTITLTVIRGGQPVDLQVDIASKPTSNSSD